MPSIVSVKERREDLPRCPPFLTDFRLLFDDGANRALASAGAAAQARIRIDDVMIVAFLDSLNRASAGAGAAGDAIVTDLISHYRIPPFKITLPGIMYGNIVTQNR